MYGQLYIDTMHVDRTNLIMWYLLIRWSDLETKHTTMTVRTSRSFLWYAMNVLMHVMQSWFLGYVDGHLSHSPWLNHGCKIECLCLAFSSITSWPRVKEVTLNCFRDFDLVSRWFLRRLTDASRATQQICKARILTKPRLKGTVVIEREWIKIKRDGTTVEQHTLIM